jgi:hypothetical protein
MQTTTSVVVMILPYLRQRLVKKRICRENEKTGTSRPGNTESVAIFERPHKMG